MKAFILTLLIILTHFHLKAQENFSISGIVLNGNGEPLQAATVFLDGSQKITKTDDIGVFKFSGISPGTYQVVVNLLGYSSLKQNLLIQNRSVTVKIILQEKQIALREVVIGNDAQRKAHLKLFIENFLGQSDNAKNCKVLNTEIIDFATRQNLLFATSEDFLIIENKNLGFHIKYLLRYFQFNKSALITSYDGECIFEEMKGTATDQKQWALNRQKAYEGSLMHYLRSLYNNTTREAGFLSYFIKTESKPLMVDPRPVNTTEIVRYVDSNFVELKFKGKIYTLYDKKRALAPDKNLDKESATEYTKKYGSLIQMNLDSTIIDSKGSYQDYRSFLIQGYWGSKRIGDQLPFEYVPRRQVQ